MLTVKTSKQARDTLEAAFGGYRTESERLPLSKALGRVLAQTILSDEDVPAFDRSMVDGYAVLAADTFGCSESSPAILKLVGRVEMGEARVQSMLSGECVYVPTGGALPAGADAMVMLEYAEDCGDGFIYLQKPSAPGAHVVFKGDDIRDGQPLLAAGTRLRAQDIGALAALGRETVPVYKKPLVAILSTGTELVPVGERPVGSQMRDVNSHTLAAAVESAGGEAVQYGILQDDEQAILHCARTALERCDLLLISGGSSVGEHDLTRRVAERLNDAALLFHGLAVKPGKPTIAASAGGKPVFGLPGHPVSAYMIFEVFLRPLIGSMMGSAENRLPITATLAQALPSNHGREEFVAAAVIKTKNGLLATPVTGKSGLITTLSRADGYLCIPRDCEGVMEGTPVEVYLF